MSQNTWTVVADSSQAIIYEGAPMGDNLQKIEKFINEDATKDKKELETDGPGQAFNRHGPGQHSMTKEVSASEHVTKMFSKTVADYLQHARANSNYARLIIVADPTFLGELRDSLDTATARLVVDTIDHNITHMNAKQIRTYLKEHVEL
jgi:protein required for attachment to host cells